MPHPIDRRAALLGFAAFATSCNRRIAAGAWHDLSFEPNADCPDGERALVFAPSSALPLLVSLHGRGESGRGLAVGAYAWRDDYAIERLHTRCLAPPLAPDDVSGLITPERLSSLNASLKAAPYRGLA